MRSDTRGRRYRRLESLPPAADCQLPDACGEPPDDKTSAPGPPFNAAGAMCAAVDKSIV